MDPANLSLFRHRRGEVLISPLILSHMLAQVVLRPELRAVFDELFGPGGAEFTFEPASAYAPAGTEVLFEDLMRSAARRGEIALGVRSNGADPHGSGDLYLNPPRDKRWCLAEGDEVVVLTNY